MSGFAVVVHRSDALPTHTLSRLKAGLRWRGLTEPTVRSLPEVTLVHVPLPTTPEAAMERQPIRHVRHDWWLVTDARIDNGDELRRQLHGRVAHPLLTDADLVMAAFERWGKDLARHLVGDFAFAIWDGETRTLVAVRDHFGLRPVYWASSDDRIVVASTLRTTLEMAELPGEPDRDFLAAEAGYAGDMAASPWRGIHRLLPATSLHIEAGDREPTLHRYWDPTSITYERRSRADVVDGLRERFDEAVRSRLRACSNVGVLLSGGFDSTTILSAASQQRPVRAYSVSFRGFSCDESRLVDAAAKRVSAPLRSLDASEVAPFDHSGFCRCTWELPLTPDAAWLVPLGNVAAGDGCRVVLTGQGGDAALYGWRTMASYDEILRRRYIRGARGFRAAGYGTKAPRLLVAGALDAWAARRPQTRASAGWRRFRTERSCPSPAARAPSVSDPWVVTRAARADLYTARHLWSSEIWDRHATLVGTEQRHPFYDLRLVEFCLSLGEADLLSDGTPRGLHRAAFGDLLPPEVFRREDKAEFSEPWVAISRDTLRDLGVQDPGLQPPLVSSRQVQDATRWIDRYPRVESGLWDWWGMVSVAVWERSGALRKTKTT
jgi:asparagine synthase (glutamine-hydrolysing)